MPYYPTSNSQPKQNIRNKHNNHNELLPRSMFVRCMLQAMSGSTGGGAFYNHMTKEYVTTSDLCGEIARYTKDYSREENIVYLKETCAPRLIHMFPGPVIYPDVDNANLQLWFRRTKKQQKKIIKERKKIRKQTEKRRNEMLKKKKENHSMSMHAIMTQMKIKQMKKEMKRKQVEELRQQREHEIKLRQRQEMKELTRRQSEIFGGGRLLAAAYDSGGGGGGRRVGGNGRSSTGRGGGGRPMSARGNSRNVSSGGRRQRPMSARRIDGGSGSRFIEKSFYEEDDKEDALWWKTTRSTTPTTYNQNDGGEREPRPERETSPERPASAMGGSRRSPGMPGRGSFK